MKILILLVTLLSSQIAWGINVNPKYNLMIPTDFQSFNECTQEDIHLIGAAYIAINSKSDGSGGYHYTYQFRINLDGLGLSTGKKYSLNNSSKITRYQSGKKSNHLETYTQHWKLISQGSSDNGYLRQTIHTTVNARGEITSAIVKDQKYTCIPFD